jgi:hypothetical protein
MQDLDRELDKATREIYKAEKRAKAQEQHDRENARKHPLAGPAS